MRYLLSGQSLRLDQNACNGCGRCEEVCPHRVIAIRNRKAILVDRDACMECGACQKNCPRGAIRVNSGVGCAQAIINSMLGKRKGECCACSCDDKVECN
jgi:NAD-dependent dihydropyrimidine dehydrogenase PreA subunit